MLSWVIVPNRSAWNSRVLQAYLKPHSATKKGFHDGLSTSLLSLEKACLTSHQKFKRCHDWTPPKTFIKRCGLMSSGFQSFSVWLCSCSLPSARVDVWVWHLHIFTSCVFSRNSKTSNARPLSSFNLGSLQWHEHGISWNWNSDILIYQCFLTYLSTFQIQTIVLIFVFFTKFLHHIAYSYTWSVATISSWATTVTRHHGNARCKDLVCWSKNLKWWGLPSFSY